ncbi:hypothetical protein VOLCADRAFT_93743 [Volvox carteri f. nagariensis]|uniref:Uncharacterized protein n=1 Tax=Volvox carteri f. nagariensis TaxID=3068 RepID=D8U2Y2_VOLCA|nr:uncharacterized protein VOLCADRAFT_93743 [Volvox carteri f. nagariensis]EFJ45981.1 hypothetical protein VOLCADRAFT_93743 [Volvox carteri f. nagariensis]|eukprot:XP_002953059.1 hypothetical protein VOLCADRAFT_93743 [Volvox carteri f. nagariensis]
MTHATHFHKSTCLYRLPQEYSGPRRPPPGSACDRCRHSDAVVFGDWEPQELASVLSVSECACAADVSAIVHFVDNKESANRRDLAGSEVARSSDSYDFSPQHSISYQEWIARRLPVKLPPGLPRPPRQQSAPASLCAVTDDDLDDDCDDWYNRNVTNGNFPDWLHEEQQQLASPATTSVQQLFPSPAGSGCSDDDLDADCEEWFNRNVAAGNFSSWIDTPKEPSAMEPSATPDEPSQQESASCQQEASAAAKPAAAFSSPAVATVAASAGFSSVGGGEESVPALPSGSAPSPYASSRIPNLYDLSISNIDSCSNEVDISSRCGHVSVYSAQCAVGAVAAGAVPDLTSAALLLSAIVTGACCSRNGGGSEADPEIDDGCSTSAGCFSIPSSPRESDSDCRTVTSSDGGYSHGNSRSSSCLSLGSMDPSTSSCSSPSSEAGEVEDGGGVYRDVYGIKDAEEKLVQREERGNSQVLEGSGADLQDCDGGGCPVITCIVACPVRPPPLTLPLLSIPSFSSPSPPASLRVTEAGDLGPHGCVSDHLKDSTDEAVLVRSLDCASWELQFEAQLRLSSVVVAPPAAAGGGDSGGGSCLDQARVLLQERELDLGSAAGGCGDRRTSFWGHGEGDGEEEEEAAVLRRKWMELQLDHLLGAVVVGTLFGAGSEGGEEVEGAEDRLGWGDRSRSG